MIFIKYKKWPVLLIFLFLAACQETILLQEMDQKNANDVLVVLAKNGIKAKKEAIIRQQETTWTLKVKNDDEQQARELLVANNLPRQRELGLSGICKEAGLIPTPKTEKCREMLAIKGEIINSLQSIPGVVSADVVVNIPDKEDFPDEKAIQKRPAASVVLQVGDMAPSDMFTESKVQQFVANSVTGMDMRDVVVIISRAGDYYGTVQTQGIVAPNPEITEPVTESLTEVTAESPVESAELVSIAGIQMNPDSAKKFKMVAGILLFCFVLLSIALIALLMRTARFRQSGSSLEHASPRAALPEKVQMDQLVESTAAKSGERSA